MTFGIFVPVQITDQSVDIALGKMQQAYELGYREFYCVSGIERGDSLNARREAMHRVMQWAESKRHDMLDPNGNPISRASANSPVIHWWTAGLSKKRFTGNDEQSQFMPLFKKELVPRSLITSPISLNFSPDERREYKFQLTEVERDRLYLVTVRASRPGVRIRWIPLDAENQMSDGVFFKDTMDAGENVYWCSAPSLCANNWELWFENTGGQPATVEIVSFVETDPLPQDVSSRPVSRTTSGYIGDRFGWLGGFGREYGYQHPRVHPDYGDSVLALEYIARALDVRVAFAGYKALGAPFLGGDEYHAIGYYGRHVRGEAYLSPAHEVGRFTTAVCLGLERSWTAPEVFADPFDELHFAIQRTFAVGGDMRGALGYLRSTRAAMHEWGDPNRFSARKFTQFRERGNPVVGQFNDAAVSPATYDPYLAHVNKLVGWCEQEGANGWAMWDRLLAGNGRLA